MWSRRWRRDTSKLGDRAQLAMSGSFVASYAWHQLVSKRTGSHELFETSTTMPMDTATPQVIELHTSVRDAELCVQSSRCEAECFIVSHIAFKVNTLADAKVFVPHSDRTDDSLMQMALTLECRHHPTSLLISRASRMVLCSWHFQFAHHSYLCILLIVAILLRAMQVNDISDTTATGTEIQRWQESATPRLRAQMKEQHSHVRRRSRGGEREAGVV